MLIVATNELTSHGAMLFAVLVSLFSLLRILNDQKGSMDTGRKLISGICISILSSISSYIFVRLLYWARLLNSMTYFDFSNKSITTYREFINEMFNYMHNITQGDIFYNIIKYGRYKNIHFTLFIIAVGIIVTTTLFYSINFIDSQTFFSLFITFSFFALQQNHHIPIGYIRKDRLSIISENVFYGVLTSFFVYGFSRYSYNVIKYYASKI